MSNLKPCPFCGSEAGKFEMVTYIPYIRCTNAFCELSKVKYSERYWNTRPIEDKQAEQIRQLINLVALAEGRDTKQAAEIERLKELLEQALVYLPHNRTTIDLLPDRIKQALAAPPQKGQDNETPAQHTGCDDGRMPSVCSV